MLSHLIMRVAFFRTCGIWRSGLNPGPGPKAALGEKFCEVFGSEAKNNEL